MKKTLIAMAALAVVSAASAQSTVTLYGLIDQSLSNQKDSYTIGGANLEGTKSGVQEGILNGSRIGFKGTEDLGGGLKANFQLEYSISPNVTTNAFTNRQSYFGLSGDFGAVTMGRQYTPYFNIVGAVDFAGEISAPGMVAMNHMIGGFRRDNAVQYVSPSFGGVQATVQVAGGSQTTSELGGIGQVGSMGKSFGGSLVYAAGPLVAAVVLDDVSQPVQSAAYDPVTGAAKVPALVSYASIAGATSSGTTVKLFGDGSSETKVWAAGGLYDFGVAKASVAYTSLTDTKLAGGPDVTSKGYNFSVSVPFGATTLIGNLGSANVQNYWAAGDGKITGYQLVAQYALSKRTTAYAVYGSDTLTVDNLSGESKRTQTNLGLRHTF